jgi:hypothetical protein
MVESNARGEACVYHAAQPMKFRQRAPACRMGVRIVRIPSAALTVILLLAAVVFTMLVAIAMR